MDKMKKIDVMIVTKDRPTEVALLLQSLRTQTYKNFDVYIMDDRSGTPMMSYHFLVTLINQMKLEGNKVIYWRNEIPYGVQRLRRITADRILVEGNGESLMMLDDDNLIEPDFFERLQNCINNGWDIASGLVPRTGIPFIKRDTKFVKPFISDVKLTKEGRIESFGDDCGQEFLQKEVIPSVNFRSMCLIKKKVLEKVKFEENLGFCSFRGEQFFSFRAILEGFKLCVDTGAIAYHTMTPSGGERHPGYENNLQANHELLSDFTQKIFKEKGDFLETYREQFK